MTTSPQHFQPSRYQQAIFDFVAEQLRLRAAGLPFRHLTIDATAGSGKTSTLVETCKRLPAHTRALVVAFGNRVAEELKQKLPRNAEAMTLHSLGNRAWATFLQARPTTVRDKVWNIIDSEVAAKRMSKYHRFKVAKLVDLARQSGIVPYDSAKQHAQHAPEGTQTQRSGRAAAAEYPNTHPTPNAAHSAVNGVIPLHGLVPDTDAAWLELCHRHDIYGDDKQSLIQAARRVLKESILWGHRGIDFADMLYLPVTANVPFDAGADVVFVDELQDLDALQRRMVVSMARTGALFVGVGDTSQAIFGFRGADCDSMRKVRQETTAVELPLSICYRCPVSHIELARVVAPQIEPRDGAPEGLLECYDGNGTLYCVAPHKHGFDCDCATVRRRSLTAAQFQPGDLVLCRSKAPLVKAAYWLIRHQIACTVLGKDIGKGLVAFIDSFRVDGTADLLAKVNRMTAQALSRAGEDDDVEDITDRRDVIAAVADACESNDVAELRTRLTHLFSDNTDRASVVTLSTIHRAKGAEADRVWWIDRQRLSLDKNFKHEWRREEEKSIIFVGSTRSRRELRFVCSEFMR